MSSTSVSIKDFNKLIRAFKKFKKETDQSIEDLWTKLNHVEDDEIAVADEAVEIAKRATRAVKRLETRVKELE